MRSFKPNPSFTAGFAIVVVLALIAVLGPMFASFDPLAINLSDSLARPSALHPFGCDALGRDVFARIMYGARRLRLGQHSRRI